MMQGGVHGLEARIRAHRLYSEHSVDFYAWVVGHVPWKGGESVLDVGCGSGAYFPYYRQKGARVTALDVSPRMIAAARQRRVDERLLLGAATALPFADASFDVVFANHVLFFVEDVPAALRECHRVLREGGYFVAATNTADSQRALYDLHAAALSAIGRRAREMPHARFSVESGLPLVKAVFGNARAHVLENAFRFPSVDAALAYYLSGPIDNVEGPPLTPAEWRAITNHVSDAIRRIIAREGFWRVPKSAGVIVGYKTGVTG